jgi:catechol 2,3-dioxygenase-like lactoylglutathione lyase family enzyme
MAAPRSLSGRFNRREYTVIGNLPLSDTFGVRVAATRQVNDGYVDAILTGKELGDENSDAARIEALWKPNDQFNLLWEADSLIPSQWDQGVIGTGRLGGCMLESTVSESESSMNSVQIGQKSYEMPPREGISIAHFLTVADIERSARYYEKVFGARILSLGDGNAPGYLQLANIWMILNVGGGPTPDKPTVTLSVPDPNHINSFMNFRVADIQACYELWKSRGAEFITEPIPKYGETRCYIRDPDGYIIEVGQSTDLAYG